MYTFFEYCYYRIQSWYIVHKVDRTPRVYSTHWVSVGQTSNVITLISFLFFYLNIKVEFLSIFFPIHIIHCWLNYSFLLTEKKYQELTEKYKNEKHKKIKGWGVFFYLIFSFVISIICIGVLRENILFNYRIDLNFIKHFLKS